jgi:hypothetical protein
MANHLRIHTTITRVLSAEFDGAGVAAENVGVRAVAHRQDRDETQLVPAFVSTSSVAESRLSARVRLVGCA